MRMVPLHVRSTSWQTQCVMEKLRIAFFRWKRIVTMFSTEKSVETDTTLLHQTTRKYTWRRQKTFFPTHKFLLEKNTPAHQQSCFFLGFVHKRVLSFFHSFLLSFSVTCIDASLLFLCFLAHVYQRTRPARHTGSWGHVCMLEPCLQENNLSSTFSCVTNTPKCFCEYFEYPLEGILFSKNTTFRLASTSLETISSSTDFLATTFGTTGLSWTATRRRLVCSEKKICTNFFFFFFFFCNLHYWHSLCQKDAWYHPLRFSEISTRQVKSYLKRLWHHAFPTLSIVMFQVGTLQFKFVVDCLALVAQFALLK